MPWETSPGAWRANVLSIEMYHGLRLMPGLRGDQLNELLELRAEKKMSLTTPSVTPQIEGLSDDEISAFFIFSFFFLSLFSFPLPCAAQNRIYRRAPLLKIVLPRARLAAHLSILVTHSTC